jgi:hypothetical protein
MRFLENPAWEGITHTAVFFLYLYVFYLMYQDPSERYGTNFLLLIIALTLGVLVHQNINARNGVYDTDRLGFEN